MGTAIVSQELQEFQFANFLRNSTLIFRKIKIIKKKNTKQNIIWLFLPKNWKKGFFSKNQAVNFQRSKQSNCIQTVPKENTGLIHRQADYCYLIRSSSSGEGSNKYLDQQQNFFTQFGKYCSLNERVVKRNAERYRLITKGN